ncbi:MAG: O-antigen ligase family protein [Coriobacteriia bacterium]|nr:O-antigen ligase family protein [Coriobacteriia bacterium]
MESETVNSTEHYHKQALKRERLIFALGALASVAMCAMLLASPPGWWAVVISGLIGLAILTWRAPAWALAAVLGSAILVEQFDFGSYVPITREIPLFENIANFTELEGVVACPIEVVLVVITAAVFLRLLLRQKEAEQNIVAMPVLVFGACMVLWLGYGLLEGGALNIAFWEMRALAYFCLIVFLTPQMVFTKRDVSVLLGTATLAVIVKAIQGAYNFFVVLGGDTTGERSVTGHEDAVFIAWILVLFIALKLYEVGRFQRIMVGIASPVLLLTFAVTNRRAAYVALALGLVILAVNAMREKEKRAVIVKAAIPMLLIFLVLIPVGWNATGPLGAPAGVVKSIIAPDDEEDQDSSYYRKAEMVNLVHSIENNPITGLGFGRPFQAAGSLVNINFSLADVIPHNNIVWIWAKMGTFGFGVFWAMVGSIVAAGVFGFHSLKNPYYRVVSLIAACAMAMQCAVSYVDLQLSFSRNMIFLGVLVGLMARMHTLDGEGAADDRAV